MSDIKVDYEVSEEIRAQIYERFFHQIQMYREVTLNAEKVKEALDIIGDWSYAHRAGNGQLSEKEQSRMINRQIDRMMKF